MIQKKFLLGLLLVPSLLLSACSFNLGTFEKGDNYQSYYDAFDNVRTLYDAGSGVGAEDTYNIKKSLFNDYTVNKMDWEKDEDKVNEREHLYIIISFKEVLKIESLSLYFRSPEDKSFTISAFYYINEDLAPKKIKYRSSPDKDPEDQPISYDDPLIIDANASYTVGLKANTWTSVTFSRFKQEGFTDGNLHTGSSSVLYLRVEDNSGYDKTFKTPVKFTFLNLLVRAVE